MAVSTADIHWLAGLIEGEGSFMFGKGSTSIMIQMTDRDVLVRAAKILGCKVRDGHYRPKGKSTYKTVFACGVFGMRAFGWMMTLYSLMGERRQAKIRSIIEAVKSKKFAMRAAKGSRMMATCHRTRLACGFGLCRNCHMRKWRAARKARTQSLPLIA